MARKYDTFTAWMAAVDAWLLAKVGLTNLDLADIAYRDLYDDGVGPAAAGRQALAGEGFYG